jgi:hypothetical protein
MSSQASDATPEIPSGQELLDSFSHKFLNCEDVDSYTLFDELESTVLDEPLVNPYLQSQNGEIVSITKVDVNTSNSVQPHAEPWVKSPWPKYEGPNITFLQPNVSLTNEDLDQPPWATKVTASQSHQGARSSSTYVPRSASYSTLCPADAGLITDIVGNSAQAPAHASPTDQEVTTKAPPAAEVVLQSAQQQPRPETPAHASLTD